MKAGRAWLIGGLVLAALPVGGMAQFLPAPRYPLAPGERLELSRGRDRLRSAVLELPEDRRADAEIFLDAVDRNLRQDLFFAASGVTQARTCLASGRERPASLARGEAPWNGQSGFVNFGYRSRVDGSVQPYQLYIPPGLDRTKLQRLDIFLHGRGGTLNELSFLTSTSWAASAFGTMTPSNLTLYPYGRANNGWRFAGERDLYEALADVKRRFRIDEDRISLRGFSMGGHGTWHIGLQHPGDWSVMAPGAGFTDTLQYQKITETLPDWQLKLLHMYDPVDYALNGRNLPLLAYCGEDDPARSQHELIMGRLKAEDVPVREYIGPKTGHAYEPARRADILAEMAPRHRFPRLDADFVTYTIRWPGYRWFRLEGLQRHWDRAEVRSRSAGVGKLALTTRNASALSVEVPIERRSGPVELTLDGQAFTVPAPTDRRLLFTREGNGPWREVRRLPGGLRKKPGLQGPIDDALFGPVLAVRGTGTPWSEGMNRWAGQELQRFRDGWDEYFRATLPETTDAELTSSEAKGKNLYLFGDPGSNRVLARLLRRLPIRWTRAGFTLAGQGYDPRERVPVFVFPNPEDPEHYVVVNCGFTFSRADWQGSNALQYPHLPDWAVLKYDAARYSDDHRANAVAAGFFDERWR